MLVEQRLRQPYDSTDPPLGSLPEDYKRLGTKYARVAAIYTEGLESRVSGVEKELLELQYEFGSKERPDADERRRVIYSFLNPKQ